MSFPARYAGTCGKCGKPINKGQYISWSRRERGKAYHASCETPDVVPVETTTTPAITPELLAEAMQILSTKIVAPPPMFGGKDELLEVLKIPVGMPVDEDDLPKKKHGMMIRPEPITFPVSSARVPKPVAAPKPSENYTEWWERLAAICGSLETIRVLLIGPPGTGKSKTGMIVADTDCELTMTEGTAVEDLIGMFQLKDNATVWVDGPAVSAMRLGKKLVINEIDHHATEIGSLLYGLMDDNPSLMLPTGERVIAAKGYGVIATSNANITALPEAIVDRCDAVLAATKPHPAALALLEDKEMIATVSNYFTSLDVKPWTFSRKPTLRVMRAYKTMLPFVGEKAASEMAFGASAAEILSVMSTAARTGAETDASK